MNWRPFVAAFSAALAFLAAVSIARTDQTVLYEKKSAYNTIVVTDEGNGVRALRFGRAGVRQSAVKVGEPDVLVLPYVPVTLVGLALTAETRRFLVVGLGGGTLPMFLRKYYPDAAIDAVDIDPDVVDVAKRFFGFREDKFMSAHVADGQQFIENSRQRYDVIFLDAFGSGSIPARLTTQEFLQAVRRVLAPGGVVVGNLWGREINPRYDSIVRTYEEVFGKLLVLDVRGTGNKILLGLSRKPPLAHDELIRRAREVSAAKRLPFDLGDLVQHGLPDTSPKVQRGRVLRDRDVEQHQRSP